ncbi:MAG: fatty acid desaturase family protein [Chloroflexota bacterium]
MTVEPLLPAAARPAPNEYAALKRLVAECGLLEPQPAYYGAKVAGTLGLLAAGLAAVRLLGATPRLWPLVPAAAFLAFVYTQIGFIAHDIGHRALLRTSRARDAAALVFGNLLLGISRSWWLEKHNAHHSHPNQVDADPDIDIPIVAFSEEEARRKRGLARLITKYQAAILFPLMFAIGAPSWRLYSVQEVMWHRPRFALVEGLLLVVHFIWYFGLVFASLGLRRGLLFMGLHQGLMGLYMGSVFAPNHKGMLVLEKDSQMDFLRQQVLTSRNVRPSAFHDFWYGGLNYQIEHHLFPSMPRNRLGEARAIAKAFCARQDIPYHETGMLQSFKEVLQFMHHVSAPLRRPDA